MRKLLILMMALLCMIPAGYARSAVNEQYCNFTSLAIPSSDIATPAHLDVSGNNILFAGVSGVSNLIYNKTATLANNTFCNVTLISSTLAGVAWNGSDILMLGGVAGSQKIWGLRSNCSGFFNQTIASQGTTFRGIDTLNGGYILVDATRTNLVILNASLDNTTKVNISAYSLDPYDITTTSYGDIIVTDNTYNSLVVFDKNLNYKYNVSMASLEANVFGVAENNTDIFFEGNNGAVMYTGWLREGTLKKSQNISANVSSVLMKNCSQVSMNFTQAGYTNVTFRLFPITINSTIEDCGFEGNHSNKTSIKNLSSWCEVTIESSKLIEGDNIDIWISDPYRVKRGVSGLPLGLAGGLAALLVIYTYTATRKSESWV